ncbi:MAG: sodium:solute symporter [Cyanobacteria bacterium K_Offshore_surface_m2_239]|nr:sodium:solute symporter [Cyanobacteria bacterium K_Offshore_surface_m2_239]
MTIAAPWGGLDASGWTLALAGLPLLLLVGTLLGRGLGVHRWGLPEALLAGGVGLLLGPRGPWPLVPEAVIQLWDGLPLILLTLVFGCLLVGKPLPRPGGLWRPLSAQVLLSLTLAFGQYLVGGIVVLWILGPWLGVSPVMACLIEVAYEGGHGSAAAMAPTYAALGVEGAEDLGLALATIGLLASTVVGGLLVLLGRWRGWVEPAPPLAAAPSPGAPAPGAGPLGLAEADGVAPAPIAAPELQPATDAGRATLRAWAVNLALTGLAVAIGWGLLEGLRALAPRAGASVAAVIDTFPVFPLALIGSLLVRVVLERTGRDGLASAAIQSRVSTLAADLLIAAATACLDLSSLLHLWRPLLVLGVAGLLWNLLVVLGPGRWMLPSPWFSRGLVDFGQSTGVAASGLLLLNMIDPNDDRDVLTPFSIKQLLLQPLVAGGVITVVAPLAVSRWGLPAWTALCLALVVLWVGLALWLRCGEDNRNAPTPGG